MAVFPRSRCWWVLVLVLGSCVSLEFGDDNRAEQALCVSCLQGKQTGFSTLKCSLKCRRALDSQRPHMCQNLLFEEDNSLSLDADPHQQLEQEAVGALMPSEDDTTSPEHQLVKKYGGFMKRYGGFMSRRSSPQKVIKDMKNLDEEENIRFNILKLLTAAKHDGNIGETNGEEIVKRSEDPIHHSEEEMAPSNLLEGVLSRGLKKRYGGFMRRVGRPEWLVNGSKSGGELKRSCENGSGLQKRYGGFMD
uniref:Proenkephalin a n=2 Tax=Nothobranchius kuhntae TaxID=321403 RepID=A0A1A8K006_NOTKU